MRRSSCTRFSGVGKQSAQTHTLGLRCSSGHHFPSSLLPSGTRAATWLGSNAKFGLLSLMETTPQCPSMRRFHVWRTPVKISTCSSLADYRTRYPILEVSQALGLLLLPVASHVSDHCWCCKEAFGWNLEELALRVSHMWRVWVELVRSRSNYTLSASLHHLTTLWMSASQQINNRIRLVSSSPPLA
jgi:hypothetical protein